MSTRIGKKNENDACYPTEEMLVNALSRMIVTAQSPIPCNVVGFEFFYASGRTDIVGISTSGDLHAFEAKLSKWKKALEQARRNACFAHYCYVVLPSRAGKAALKSKEQFQRQGIGLICMENGEPKIEIEPKRNAPLLPWLTDAARTHVESESR